MKKFYLFLISAIATLCCSVAAHAASGSISWNHPGAVEIFSWNSSAKELTAYDIADDALKFDVGTAGNTSSYYVHVKDGYEVVSFSGIKPNGYVQTIYKSSPWGYEGELAGKLYNVSFNMSNDGTDFVLELVTEAEAKAEALFTLDIENGSRLITGIFVGSREIEYADGSHDVSFRPALEKSVTLNVMNGKNLYSVKHNGNAVEALSNFGSRYYQIDNLKANDIISVRGYENDNDFETCKVTVLIPDDVKAAITQVWNNTMLQPMTLDADGSYTVGKGDIITIRFDEDYTVKSVKVNGKAISVTEQSTGSLTINEDTVIEIEATPTVYKDVTWTVYIVEPEGVTLHAGKGNEGYDLPLTDGVATTEDIQFKAAKEDGVLISPAMTIPAGTAWKYTLSVSSKYPTLMFTANDGYWIKASRDASLSAEASIPVSSKTFYIVAQKIARSATAAVYLSSDNVSASLNFNNENRMSITEQGYKVFDFDPEYDSPITARFLTNDVKSPLVCVDGMPLTADENGLYTADIHDGAVIKMFGDGKQHKESTVAVKTEGGAAAEISYDKIKKAEGDFICFDGTEVCIKAAANTAVKVDGKEIDSEADGSTYIFTTTGTHTIALSYVEKATDEYIITPQPGSKTESLDEITIAFPNAKEVTKVLEDDYVMLMAKDMSWAAAGISVEEVKGAECPTFVIIPAPAPQNNTVYDLYIDKGFFSIDGTDSPEIEASFTLEKVLSEIEVQFSPVDDVAVGDFHEVLNIVFDENLTVKETAGLADKITVEFDGTALAADDYTYMAEACYFMIMLTNDAYLKAGAVTVKLAEGALDLSGRPSPAIEHTWHYIKAKEYTCAITPDGSKTVTDLSKISISFDNAESVEIWNNNGVNLKAYVGGDYLVFKADLKVIENAETPTVEAVFSPAPDVSGDYTLSIDPETFTLDGTSAYPSYSTGYIEVEYSFTATNGIEGIIADGEANEEIYNLQGIKVNAKWNDLPAGLYIVGGRKMVKN